MVGLFGFLTMNLFLELALFTTSGADCLTIWVFIQTVVAIIAVVTLCLLFNNTTSSQFLRLLVGVVVALRQLHNRATVLSLRELHFHLVC